MGFGVMSVLTKENWVAAGLEILKLKGYAELSIVRLSNQLGVTRGSFYHHFKSLNHFIDAMIDSWEERIVNKGFEQTLTDEKHPEIEFKNLISYVTQLHDKYDLVFRQWAPSNPHVKKHMERLDKKRMGRLVELMQRLSNDKAEGEKLAKIAFYAYIGSLHTFPYLNAAQQKKAAVDMLEVILGYLENAKQNN